MSDAPPPLPPNLPPVQTPQVKGDNAQQVKLPASNVPKPEITPERVTATPVEVQLPQTPVIADPATGLPQPGSTVNLQSLPPNLAAEIIVPPVQIIPATLPENINLAALVALPLSETAPALTTQTSGPLPSQSLQTNTAPLIKSEILPGLVQTNPPAIAPPTQNIEGDAIKLPQAPNRFSAPPQTNFLQTPQPIEINQSQLLSPQIPTSEPLNFTATIDGYERPAPVVERSALSERVFETLAREQPSPLLSNKAGQLTATVQGFTPSTLPVLGFSETSSFFNQPYILQIPSPSEGIDLASALPEGSRISLTVQTLDITQSNITTQTLPAAAIPLPAALTPEPWLLLDEIQTTLNQAAPQAAQAFSNVVPSASNPAQFGPALMMFVAAVRGGDLSGWLSEKAIETLSKSGKGSLISRLGAEGRALSQTANEPVTQDWRGLSVPYANQQGDIQKIALFFREEDAENQDDERGKKQARFIFDLSLDAMGPVQLDGLFRPEAAAPRLDLTLRTETPFSRSAQVRMKEIYAEAIETANVAGDLTFQNHPDAWVKVNAVEQQEQQDI